MTTTMPGRSRVTAPPADTVTLPCADCGDLLTITRDENREHCDRGTRPRHTTCPAVVKLPASPPRAPRPKPAGSKLTAAEVVLLAAADLDAAGNREFSEWDLTVAAWSLDRQRFGLRGYADRYPDHKRCSMEIMGQKVGSPVCRKYLEKVRPNTYTLTPLGKAQAALLRKAA